MKENLSREIVSKKVKAGLIALVLILTASFITMTANAATEPSVSVTSVSPEKREVVSTVSTTGKVESKSSSSIYSFLTYKVVDVNVEVGDKVAAGDVLAQLDTADLELSIAQQRAAVGASQSQAQHQINVAASSLSNAEMLLAEGYDMKVIQAQAQVDATREALELAKLNLNNAVDQNKSSTSGGTVVPGTSFTVTVDNDKKTPGLGNLAEDQARIAKRQAEDSYRTARKNLEATLVASDIEIETYENTLKGAKIGANYSSQMFGIKQLELQLAQATITSPQDGVVTSVSAIKGASGQGLLFTVEDISDLRIVTAVKDYDLSQVKTGQKVVIRSDATGDDEFQGSILKIAPTALRAESGLAAATSSSSSVEFETIVDVEKGNDTLRVGTSARMDIILDSKSNALSVPFDAIGAGANGEDVVFVIEEKDGRTYAKAVPIKVGVESEFYAEISGEGITDKTILVEDAETVKDGQEVVVS